jgi:hypothetical protein
MTPSKEAIEMAADFITPTHWLNDIARTKEVAERIDTALAKARLEGAEAMQVRCLSKFAMPIGCDAPVLATQVQLILKDIDPQQVINERMGK